MRGGCIDEITNQTLLNSLPGTSSFLYEWEREGRMKFEADLFKVSVVCLPVKDAASNSHREPYSVYFWRVGVRVLLLWSGKKRFDIGNVRGLYGTAIDVNVSYIC